MFVRDLQSYQKPKKVFPYSKMDASGDWHIIDRYTGIVYKSGIRTEEQAKAWAGKMNMQVMSHPEQIQAMSRDPLMIAYAREYPDSIFVTQ